MARIGELRTHGAAQIHPRAVGRVGAPRPALRACDAGRRTRARPGLSRSRKPSAAARLREPRQGCRVSAGNGGAKSGRCARALLMADSRRKFFFFCFFAVLPPPVPGLPPPARVVALPPAVIPMPPLRFGRLLSISALPGAPPSGVSAARCAGTGEFPSNNLGAAPVSQARRGLCSH